MNIAKHMEAVFFGAVALSCALVFATTEAPVITVYVNAPVAQAAEALPTVVVTGHRA